MGGVPGVVVGGCGTVVFVGVAVVVVVVVLWWVCVLCVVVGDDVAVLVWLWLLLVYQLALLLAWVGWCALFVGG